MKVHQKDGIVVSCSFHEKPKITYSNNVITLITTDTQVEYPLSELSYLSFDVSVDAIEQISTDNALDNTVRIYNINGVLIKSYSRMDDSINVPLESLPTGIYVIKHGKTTYKVIKR